MLGNKLNLAYSSSKLSAVTPVMRHSVFATRDIRFNKVHIDIVGPSTN